MRSGFLLSLNDSKNISFLSNVNINSSYVEISASSAIYDDKKEVQDDVQVTLEKVEMLAEQVLGKKIKVENPDVV